MVCTVKSPGINSKSRVSYPDPGFLSVIYWHRCYMAFDAEKALQWIHHNHPVCVFDFMCVLKVHTQCSVFMNNIFMCINSVDVYL